MKAKLLCYLIPVLMLLALVVVFVLPERTDSPNRKFK